MRIKHFSLLLASSISLILNAQSVPKQVKILDKYIQEAIKVWNPPGFAVTVVKDGQVVFTKGYGVQTIGKENKVDEHTLFVCASTTKAFTAAALAMLVDEEKVNWDDHVIHHLPNFQLSDPYMTREITVRDLLTHRTGMGNTDYLWTWMAISSDSALYKMRESKPAYSMRSSFIYQNLMYLAAGKVIEAVSGQTWESFVKERIYQPLGMNETFATCAMVKDQQNKADAHYTYQKEIIRIDQTVADEIGPAGSMWSSVNDMSKWVKFLLNNGVHLGDTLIKQSSFLELFKPQQIIPADQFYPSQQLTQPNWTTYGLGWFQHDYRGKIVQFHTGSLPGMVALCGLLPEENLGVYVMGNLDHVELRHAIMYASFDLFMDGEITRDWSMELKSLYDNMADTDEEEPKHIPNTKPDIPVQKIMGKYKHQQYGVIEISQTDSVIHFNFNNKVTGKMERWHYDTYQISYDKIWYSKSMVNFRLDAEGELNYMDVFGEKFYLLKSAD